MDRRDFIKTLLAAPVALKFASDELVKEALAMFNPHRVYFDMAVPGADKLVNVSYFSADSDFGWSDAMHLLYPMYHGRHKGLARLLATPPAAEARFENGRWQAEQKLIVPG